MLEFDLPTIIFQVLNFLALTALLYYVFFRPVMRRVEARAAEKAQLTQDMQAELDQAANLRAELETQLERIDEDAEEVVSKALDRIHDERSQLMAEAEAEVERILAEAHLDAKGLRQRFVDEFHGEVLDTVLELSGHVIRETAPEETQALMIQQLADRVWELGRTEMQQVDTLRRALGQRTPVATVTSAKALSSEQQARLTRTFSALADRDVQLEVSIDPHLILGLRVRLGDMIFDNSVMQKLQAMRDVVAEKVRETDVAGTK